jgi:hypothetical protein
MTHLLPPPAKVVVPTTRLRPRTLLRVFPVQPPVTLFVRASNCQVTVQYHALDQVELRASLYAGFGMRLAVEQDEAGVYVVARRRRLLGLFSRSEFTVTVPYYAHLAFNLTPGIVRLPNINGTLAIPPLAAPQFKPILTLTPLPDPQLDRLPSGRKPT